MSRDPRPGGSSIRVFVSYAHDSEEHKSQVRTFARFLRDVGVEARMDAWGQGRRRDWFEWCIREIRSADFIRVIASPACRRVGDGDVSSDEHRGLQSEFRILKDLYHTDAAKWIPRRILPVVLPGRLVGEIPVFLQPGAADHYVIKDFSEAGAADLLRHLRGESQYPMPPVASWDSATDRFPLATTADPGIDEVLAASLRHRAMLNAAEVDHGVLRSSVLDMVLSQLGADRPDSALGASRVVPIRGAPGAGKSVIAGQLCDALNARPGFMAVVVPCDQVPGDTA